MRMAPSPASSGSSLPARSSACSSSQPPTWVSPMKICGTVMPPLARSIISSRRSRSPLDVDLREGRALAFQQRLGRVAIGAIAGGVDFDRGHFGFGRSVDPAPVIWWCARARQPGRRPARRHGRRPARSSARAQVSTVAPEVSTSSISTSRRPATWAFSSAGTRKAPCTLSARSALDRPTCCGVARTRLSAPCSTGTPAHVAKSRRPAPPTG